MAVDDFGDYDVQPVDHNPFGSMADSPDNYDIAAVDHDPFASAGETPAPSGGIGSDARYRVAPPLGWNPPPLDPADRDNLIKTIYGEASSEPALGQAGVAHAILNRVAAGGYTGNVPNTITNVVHAGVPNPHDAARGYHEFSPWNPPGLPDSNPTAQHLSPDNPAYASIGSIVDKVYRGDIPDPTYGATHYYGRMRGVPKWSPPLAALNRVKIGNQTFVGGTAGPGQSPAQTASSYAGGGAVQLNADLRRRLALLNQPRYGLAEGGDPDLQQDTETAPDDHGTGPADVMSPAEMFSVRTMKNVSRRHSS